MKLLSKKSLVVCISIITIAGGMVKYSDANNGEHVDINSKLKSSYLNMVQDNSKIEVLKNGVSKISSTQGNIYINENKGIIDRIEKIENHTVAQAVEYDVLDDNGTLFNVDSPVNGLGTKSNPFTNIYIHQNDTIPGTQGDTTQNSKG